MRFDKIELSNYLNLRRTPVRYIHYLMRSTALLVVLCLLFAISQAALLQLGTQLTSPLSPLKTTQNVQPLASAVIPLAAAAPPITTISPTSAGTVYAAGIVSSIPSLSTSASANSSPSFNSIPTNQILDLNSFRSSLTALADQQRQMFQSVQPNASNSAVVVGSGNTAAGNGNMISGDMNAAYGLDLSILGSGNAIKGSNSTITGN